MARQFNGSSAYLELGEARVTATPLTMACWFYADTLVDACAISLSPSSSNSNAFALQLWSDGIVYATAATAGGSLFAASTATYSASSWNHAVAIFASSTSRSAYLNGANKGNDTASGAPAGPFTFTLLGAIRSSPAVSQFVNGRLAEVGIWNVALTDSEVRALARGFAPLMVRPDALIYYLPLFGKHATSEYDWCGGNGRDFVGPFTTVGAHPPNIIYPNSRKYFFQEVFLPNTDALVFAGAM